MAKKFITGIGGIFYKSKNPASMYDWYNNQLGIPTNAYGTTFEWRHIDRAELKGETAWCLFKDTSDHFLPSEKEFMINFRVHDLDELLEHLKQSGIEPLGPVQNFDYGRFAHILDPEGNKLELWEPNEEVLGEEIENKI